MITARNVAMNGVNGERTSYQLTDARDEVFTRRFT